MTIVIKSKGFNGIEVNTENGCGWPANYDSADDDFSFYIDHYGGKVSYWEEDCREMAEFFIKIADELKRRKEEEDK